LVIRCKHLLEALLTHAPVPAMLALLSHLAQVSHDSRSIAGLWVANSHMLAEMVAQRSAESGEHYITRDGAEYRRMLGKALGGGAVIGLTTWVKFALLGLALSPFWAGLAAGTNYAVNNSGVSVGQVQYTVGGSTVWRGFRTTGGTNAIATTGDDLPPPPDGSASSPISKANTVSSIGIAAGSYFIDSTYPIRAVFWKPRSGTSTNEIGIALGSWKPPFPETIADKRSEILSVNASGLAVGWSGDSTTNRATAIAVGTDGSFGSWKDLNDRHFVHGLTGWSLQKAVGVNSSGVIAGNGLLNGTTRGFILIPRTTGQ
jgi:hypothetical protein